MEIKNAKRWAKGGTEPYLMGLAGYFVAFALRFALAPMLDDRLPMLFFAINCCMVAFAYGFWPAFWMLLLSLSTALFFFVKPFYAFDGVAQNDMFILIVYFTLVVLVAGLLEWVRREQYRATLIARVSDTRYRLLVEADEDRRAILKKEAP
ncbi:MAG: DUF4118 domain-containing protein [Rhodocyclaceae bacterium]|nr:DUF4118 domain-containing protein [Rhodocyclaceae bacterium]